MTSEQVIIGAHYIAKISGGLTVVKILNKRMITRGWTARNLKTGRRVQILSCQKLRRLVTDEQWKEFATLDENQLKEKMGRPKTTHKRRLLHAFKTAGKG